MENKQGVVDEREFFLAILIEVLRDELFSGLSFLFRYLSR